MRGRPHLSRRRGMATCRESEGSCVTILIIQILNSLFYASVLFLIAAGLSLIFGVMRIVNMAHGTFYAVGAFVTAWLVGRAIALGVPAGWTFLLIPVGAGAVGLLGVVIEPLLRPFYRRAEEYQLLVTFGLLLILEDVIRLLWGGLPLSSGDGCAAHRPDRGPDLSGLQPFRDRDRCRCRIAPVGGDLPHQIRCHAARDVAGSPHGLGARDQCRAGLRVGICDRLLHGGAPRRRHWRRAAGGGRGRPWRCHYRLHPRGRWGRSPP